MSEVTDTNTGTSKDDTKFPVWLYVFFAVVGMLVVFLLGLYFSEFNKGFGWGSQEKFAQFGDFVGGTLNPILGFATVALLVWSINVQMKDLRLTREEIAATKDEAAMSRKEMQDQVVHLEKEAKLMELYRLLKEQFQEYEKITSLPISYFPAHLYQTIPTYNEYINNCFNEGAISNGTRVNIEHYFVNETTKNESEVTYDWDCILLTVTAIATLTVQYIELSQSREFTAIYGHRAGMLTSKILRLSMFNNTKLLKTLDDSLLLHLSG